MIDPRASLSWDGHTLIIGSPGVHADPALKAKVLKGKEAIEAALELGFSASTAGLNLVQKVKKPSRKRTKEAASIITKAITKTPRQTRSQKVKTFYELDASSVPRSYQASR